MAKCFCGFDHSKHASVELHLLAEAYHDLIQGAHPDKEWMENVQRLQVIYNGDNDGTKETSSTVHKL